MSAKNYLLYLSQPYSFAILRPLQKAILERGDSVAWYVANDAAKHYLAPDEVLLETVAQVMAYQPRAVFAPSNVVPYFFPGIKVELFHGFNAQKRGATAHFNIRGFSDLYCTQGPDTTLPFNQLAKQHKHFGVIETGWTKLDPMFRATKIVKKEGDKPIILFASTFSKNLTAAPSLLKTIKTLTATEDFQWLVTFHPKMAQDIVDAYKEIQGPNLRFIETDDVIPLLLEADMMICDTSSILQEFLLLNKPVVTFKNRQPVDCLINITETEQLLPAIKKALTRPGALMKKIHQYAQHLHPYDDGKSCQRVLKAVDEFIKSGYKKVKRKPLNLIRKIKIRKKLAYYWF